MSQSLPLFPFLHRLQLHFHWCCFLERHTSFVRMPSLSFAAGSSFVDCSQAAFHPILHPSVHSLHFHQQQQQPHLPSHSSLLTASTLSSSCLSSQHWLLLCSSELSLLSSISSPSFHTCLLLQILRTERDLHTDPVPYLRS